MVIQLENMKCLYLKLVLSRPTWLPNSDKMNEAVQIHKY